MGIFLKIGEVLLLEPKYAVENEQYRTKILEVTDHLLMIDYPVNMTTHKTMFLVDGAQLKVTYIGLDGSVYIFDTEVLGKVKSTIPMISLRNPQKDDRVKIQRREFVRVESALDVAVHAINEEFAPFTTVTEDISAGGTAIYVPKNLSFLPDSRVKVWFAIPLKSGDIHYMTIECQVVRLIEREEATKNLLSLQFGDVEKNNQQLLIRYCFEKQLEQRNRELLSGV